MKQLVFVVLFFLTISLHAQEVAYSSKATTTEKTEVSAKLKEKSSKVTQIELQALRKENQHLKMLLKEHDHCVNEKHKGEVTRLNVGNAVEQQKMKKRKEKTLTPPL